MATIGVSEYAARLGLSGAQVGSIRAKLRRQHGKAYTEEMLRLELRAMWQDTQDVPLYLASAPAAPTEEDRERLTNEMQRGYTRSGARAIDDVECVPLYALDAFTAASEATFAVIKAKPLAQKQARSRARRLQQAENRARKQGVDPTPHLTKIDREIQALEERAA